MNKSEMYDELYITQPHRWGDDNGRDAFVSDNIPQPKSVLDIGCGHGHTLEHLSKVWPGTELYGVDISPVAIEMAKKKVDATFFVGTIDDLDIKVDVATLLGVAEHFENLDELGRVKNLLNDDGLVYIEVPNCLSYRPGPKSFRGGGVQTEWHLPRDEWERKIKEQGYNIIKEITGKKVTWEFIWILKENK